MTETTRVLETSDHEAMVLKQQLGADGERYLGFGPDVCLKCARLPTWVES